MSIYPIGLTNKLNGAENVYNARFYRKRAFDALQASCPGGGGTNKLTKRMYGLNP